MDDSLKSSSDKFKCNKPSLDLFSSKKKKEEREKIKDKRKEKSIHKGLGDNKKRVLLENKKYILELI